MKYKVGDRFRYFSIVGMIERKNNTYDLFDALCDCGEFFQFPTNKIYARMHKPCSATSTCSLWARLNKKENNWPIDRRKRRDVRATIKREKESFRKVVYKSCKTCNKKDLSLFFHPRMQHTCFKCLGSQTPEEFRNSQRKRKYNKQLNKIRPIKKIIGGAQDKDGYIYIMYSPSMNLYKIGVAKNPFIRVKTIAYTEYKIKDLAVLCIGNPIGRSFDCEGYIHKMIRQYKVEYKKPCGGMTNELFSCTLITASNIFLSVCQEAYWLDDNTRDLVDFNIPKISIDEVNIIRGQKRGSYKRPDRVYVNKIAKRLIKDKDKTIVKPWNNYRWNKYSNMSCYAMGDRKDHRFECYYDKYGSAISLGVYDNYEDAQKIHKEFASFIQRERANVKKCRAYKG